MRRNGEETHLGHCYQQIPLRVMPSFSFDNEPAALLYLITLTTGLMDGDGHLITLTAREGTRSVITGQSATRVHPAGASFASQQYQITVEDNAHLVVLPGPTIPYRGARFYQRGRIDLAPTARMMWADIWFAGRYERGELSERFVFERIVQDFEVRRAGELIYRDRFCWDGPWTLPQQQWFFGGELAAASLFVGGPLPEGLPEASPHVHRSVFNLDNGEHCLRWVGSPMHVSSELATVALHIAGFWTGGPGARPWLLESSSLSPNHWWMNFPAAPYSLPPEEAEVAPAPPPPLTGSPAL
jgi:urease accessory protein